MIFSVLKYFERIFSLIVTRKLLHSCTKMSLITERKGKVAAPVLPFKFFWCLPLLFSMAYGCGPWDCTTLHACASFPIRGCFIKWGTNHSYFGDRYIKEGSTVSVMGVIQRNNNMLMIVPPAEPVSTGCLWTQCVFPSSLDGIVLRCEDTSDMDVIPV